MMTVYHYVYFLISLTVIFLYSIYISIYRFPLTFGSCGARRPFRPGYRHNTGVMQDANEKTTQLTPGMVQSDGAGDELVY